VPIVRRKKCIYATLGTCYSVWLHTRQSSTQNNKFQVSYKSNCFSWWWAHSHPKCVEKRNKHTKKNCAPSWLYLQDYSGMHSQQNIKFNMYGIWNSPFSSWSYCAVSAHMQNIEPMYYEGAVNYSHPQYIYQPIYFIKYISIIKTPPPCGWYCHAIWRNYGTYNPCPYCNFILKF